MFDASSLTIESHKQAEERRKIKKQPRPKPKSVDAKGADRIDYVNAEQGREACLDTDSAGRLSQGTPETHLHVCVEQTLRSVYEMKRLEAEKILGVSFKQDSGTGNILPRVIFTVGLFFT